MMIFYLFLLMGRLALAMEQPPILISSTDGRHTWHLGQEVVAQIDTLQNQNRDLHSNQAFLSPAVDPENFTALLPLLSSEKREIKTLLREKNSSQLSQIARDADCIGAQTLLNLSMRALERLVAQGQDVQLPEPLHQELVQNFVRKDSGIRSILLKTIEHPSGYFQSQEVRVRGIADRAIQIDTAHGRKQIDLNGFTFTHEPDQTHIIRSSSGKKALIFNESEVLCVNTEQHKVIQKWNLDLPSAPSVLLPYDKGMFIISTNPQQNNNHPCKYIIHYHLEGDSTQFIPFKDCFPTALALSHDGAKLIVCSASGHVSIFNSQTGAIDTQLRMPLDNMPQRERIHAVTVDQKFKHIAIGKRHCLALDESKIELLNIKKLTHEESGLLSSDVDDLCFDKAGCFLYVLESRFVSIWDTKHKNMVHKIKSITFDGPYACKIDTLMVDDLGVGCTIYGHYVDYELEMTLIDKKTMQELARCSLPSLAFLVRANKKISEGKQITSADEPDLKTLRRLLPASLQSVIAKHMPWKDWIFS